MDGPSEFLIPPDTPPQESDNGGYTSGNPSQYASYLQDDSDDEDYEDSDNEAFPTKLTKALVPPAQSRGLDSDEGDSDADDSDESGEVKHKQLTEEQEQWLHYNSDLVQLHDTMQAAEDNNLAHQLLNAHGLKTTRYDWEKLKSGELKTHHHRKLWQRTIPDSEVARKAFETDDSWTAWPLEPEIVPRMEEEQVLEDRRWSERIRPHLRPGLRYKPSAELETHLGAAILKVVGEKWHKRKFTKYDEGESDVEEDDEEVMRELGIERGEETEEMRAGYERQQMKEQLYDPMDNVEEDVWRRTYRRYRDCGGPALEADDAINAAKMKPAISHALSRLDDLLAALRRNRLAVKTREVSQPNSRGGQSQSQPASAYGSQTPSEDESQTKAKPRSRGRPRKKRKLYDIPEAPESQNKKARGRPKKVRVPLPGETDREMLIRVARVQKKPIPIFSDEEVKGEAFIKDEYIDTDMIEEEELDDEPAKPTPLVDDDDEEQPAEENEDDEEAEAEEEDYIPHSNPNAPIPFIPITQDQILKDSDGSSDDLTSEAVLRPYDNWPFPEESWPERRKRILEKRARKEKMRKDEDARWGKRDWRDVVGVAASIGFNPKVIERTVARMTSMLGEDFDLRVFTRLPKGDAETLVKYSPDQIPSDDGLFESSVEERSSGDEENEDDDGMETDDSNATSSQKTSSTHSRTDSKGSSNTKLEDGNKDSDNELSSGSGSSSDSEDEFVYECPIETCELHIECREMSSQKALRAHLRKRHDWTEADIEDFYEVETDEEECVGGVHRDGFLMKMKSEEWYDRRRERDGEGSGSESQSESGNEEGERDEREVSVEL